MQAHQTPEQVTADAAHRGARNGAVEAILCLGAAGYIIYAVVDAVRHIIAARKGS